jgi:hypothetical protein
MSAIAFLAREQNSAASSAKGAQPTESEENESEGKHADQSQAHECDKSFDRESNYADHAPSPAKKDPERNIVIARRGVAHDQLTNEFTAVYVAPYQNGITRSN